MIQGNDFQFTAEVKPDPDQPSVRVDLEFTKAGLQVGDDAFETITWAQTGIALCKRRSQIKLLIADLTLNQLLELRRQVDTRIALIGNANCKEEG